MNKIKKYKFWKDGNHAIVLDSNSLIDQIPNYIHQNPVEEMLVAEPEDYLSSSARNYANIESVLDIQSLE